MVSAELFDLVKPEDGLVSARIFRDPQIYQSELERVFCRGWLFVAHDSEIPEPGDFVTRSMGADPVIVSRDRNGEIHVMLNVCRHRGRKVCGEEQGRTVAFRCGYHGWTYTEAGELVGVPFFDAYEGRLEKANLGLKQVAGVASYHGLIFATWDPDAGSLDDYLGPLRWSMDLLFGRSEAVEVVGPPSRWTPRVNWKLGAANFVGDGQHIITTHGFSTQLGLHSFSAEGRPVVFSVPTDNGHGVVLSSWPSGINIAPFMALPEPLWPEFERHLSREQVEVLRPLLAVAGNVFPNFSFLQAAGHTPAEWGGPEGQAISFLTIRQWQPLAPDRMEAWSWLLMDRNAPDWWKEASRQCYQRTFGMAGTFEQDDMENWAQITEGLGGPKASELSLHYEMGLDAAPSPMWTGEGDGYLQQPFSDLNERVFYQHWLELMTQA